MDKTDEEGDKSKICNIRPVTMPLFLQDPSPMYKSNFVERKTCFYLSRKVISPRDVVGLDLAS